MVLDPDRHRRIVIFPQFACEYNPLGAAPNILLLLSIRAAYRRAVATLGISLLATTARVRGIDLAQFDVEPRRPAPIPIRQVRDPPATSTDQ